MKTKTKKNTRPRCNVALLERVKEHILEEPKRLDMGGWCNESSEVACHTVGCIAGWAMALTLGNEKAKRFVKKAWESGQIRKEAEKLLKLDTKQSQSLFFTQKWPTRFAQAYGATGDVWDPDELKTVRAAVTAARIDHFIRTGK